MPRPHLFCSLCARRAANSFHLFMRFIADMSTISHLNAELIISTLKVKQRAFHKPQFAYNSVTFLFTSNTHFYFYFYILFLYFYIIYMYMYICTVHLLRRLCVLRRIDKPSTKANFVTKIWSVSLTDTVFREKVFNILDCSIVGVSVWSLLISNGVSNQSTSLSPCPTSFGWSCHLFNSFNPKLVMQILPTIQEENDWVM